MQHEFLPELGVERVENIYFCSGRDAKAECDALAALAQDLLSFLPVGRFILQADGIYHN